MKVKGNRSHIGALFQPGRNDIVVTMTSATFERQRRQSINVVETPFDVQLEQLPDEQTRTHRLTLKPDIELIKDENLVIAAMLTGADGSEWSYDVMKNIDNDWQLTLTDLQAGEEYSLALQIRGETVKGRSLFLQPPPLLLIDRNIPAEVDDSELSVIEDIEAELESELDSFPEDTVEKLQIEDEQVEDEMATNLDDFLHEPDEELLIDIDPELTASPAESALSPAIKIAVGNGIILLFVGIGVFVWRRKSAAFNPGVNL